MRQPAGKGQAASPVTPPSGAGRGQASGKAAAATPAAQASAASATPALAASVKPPLPVPPSSSGLRPPAPSSAVLDDIDLVEEAIEERPSSLDHLLAKTDRGWEVEDHILNLREAAAITASSTTEGSGVSARVGPPSMNPRSSKGPPPLPRKGPPPAPGPAPASRAPASPPSRFPESPASRAPESPASRFPEAPASRMPESPRRTGRDASPVPPRASADAPGAPIRGAVDPGRPPMRTPADVLQPEALVDLLQARATSLETQGDPVGAARALVELAVVADTVLGDGRRAAMHAQSALRLAPMSGAAHALVRRAHHARSSLGEILEHLEQELAVAPSDRRRVDLLCEKARVLEAMGGRGDEVRAAWERALDESPSNAAALKGLEAELVSRTLVSASPTDWDALAAHLGRMADAYAGDPRLSAWLHVERARVLERRLDRVDAARASLDRGLALDPKVGPVRDALSRFVAVHADWSALVGLLDEEARLEEDGARAARLELDAGLVATWRVGDPARALGLLERAAARAPTSPSVDRRALDELVRAHEREARWSDAARARRARLRFVSEPAALSYELQALGAVAERAGDLEAAIADVQRALALDATDPSLAEWLDRLLASTGKHEPRVAMWLQEAARAEEGRPRARALVAAARICEELGRKSDALRHLRSAWVTCPGDAEALDGLARLLAPSAPDTSDAGARALVEIYGQAADEERDAGRQIAYLERVALLWEEVLGDPSRASKTYERVLTLDPDRRGAVMGLQRTAARVGDDRTVARALLDEARLTQDKHAELALRVRAAAALAKHDPGRAAQVVREVLERDASHGAAREIETRLASEAGRWELAAKSLRAQIEADGGAIPAAEAARRRRRVSLWLTLAQIQHLRLRSSSDALASLERARALDPSHPVPPEEIVRVLETHGEARVMRDTLERLAAGARTPEARAEKLARAAEIDELRMNDDTSASRALQRALTETPDDELLADRLARIAARRSRKRTPSELAEVSTFLSKRLERAETPEAKRALSFDLATALVDASQEPMRAASLLEGLVNEDVPHVPALRTLEWLRRRAAVDVASLARVLSRQARAFEDVRARLGALWSLAALEEWTLPNGDPSTTYATILELDPKDAGALEAVLRLELGRVRKGEPGAKLAAISALRSLVPLASDGDLRFSLQLRLAMLLESSSDDESPDVWKEAIERYRDALGIDRTSWTAATGVARLAARIADTEASLVAAESLAELADDPRTRARFWLDAAELLLGPDDDARLGTRPERRERAVGVLERALEADPDSIPVAGRLATALLELRQGERLVTAFRAALSRARSVDAVVMLGSEVARVARAELNDLPTAIDAMRRVRAIAPQHVASLLTLAELCIAQRVWPDAVEALEAVVTVSHETAPRLTAYFALASIHEKVLAHPAEVDRVLRAALTLEPNNVRALRALARRMAAEPADLDEASARARRREVASLLDRLAEVETDLDARSGILLELSEVHARLGDRRAAERSLVMAVATAPRSARAFGRLAAFFRGPNGADTEGYARALGAAVALGDQFGRVEARWLATLGHVELALRRTSEGIAHLARSVDLDPTLFETRIELAAALGHADRHAEAARVLVSMIDPSPQPLLSTLEPAAALTRLETELSADLRTEEATLVAELRAVAGDLDEGRVASLRARRPPSTEAQVGALDRPTLVAHVLPAAGRHVLLEVAAAIAGVEAKVLRSELGELGIAARDRVLSRSGHPTRALLDRLARQLGVGDVDLVVTAKADRVRVLSQDSPWVVVPASLVDRPEPTQLAALARAVVRIAFGVPWLDELEAPAIESFLVAAARQVAPSYGADAPSTASYSAALARALTRRQRRLLDDLAPHLGSRAAAPAVGALMEALRRAEVRAAYLLTGDLLAVVEEVGLHETEVADATRDPGGRALQAVLEHAQLGDVVRFALTPEATSLRRKLAASAPR